MTDSEKLDLLLEKQENLEREMKALKRQQMKDTAELKAMDSMILNEVERVHEIMLARTEELKRESDRFTRRTDSRQRPCLCVFGNSM